MVQLTYSAVDYAYFPVYSPSFHKRNWPQPFHPKGKRTVGKSRLLPLQRMSTAKVELITTTIIIIIKTIIPRQPHLQLPSLPRVEQGGVRLHGLWCNMSWWIHHGCGWPEVLYLEVGLDDAVDLAIWSGLGNLFQSLFGWFSRIE